LPKTIQQKYSQPYSAPLMIDFARRTLKVKKIHIRFINWYRNVSHEILQTE